MQKGILHQHHMRLEIEFYCEYLSPNSGVGWETPLGLMIQRTPFTRTYGDTCLHGADGYSLELIFWWFVFFSVLVQRNMNVYMIQVPGSQAPSPPQYGMVQYGFDRFSQVSL